MSEKEKDHFCTNCMKYYCGFEHKCEIDNEKEEKTHEN